MHLKILLIYLACVLAAHASTAIRPTSFVLIGDSTTANDTVPNSGGWGNGFCGSAITGNIASLITGTPCINTAHDGATTGSFVTNFSTYRWPPSRFGHNDMKIASPESMGANLTMIVEEIRAVGGEPVLVTSLTRRTFNANGTIQDALEPWANETILISQQQGTHLLDLHRASIKYVEAIGPDAAHRLNRLPDDDTHLNVNGTTVFGRMVADLMRASFPLQLPIIPNPPLSFNISHGIASF